VELTAKQEIILLQMAIQILDLYQPILGITTHTTLLLLRTSSSQLHKQILVIVISLLDKELYLLDLFLIILISVLSTKTSV